MDPPSYVPLICNAMHRIKNRLDDMLAPYGITNQQARLLGFVYAKSRDGVSVCQKDVEARMDLKASSVTSLIHGLEKNGFLVRHCGEQDARRKILLLTEKGTRLQETFRTIFEEGERVIVAGMTEGQKKTLSELMGMVLRNLQRMAEHSAQMPPEQG